MLLSITVENILSFRERTEVSFAPVLKNSKYNPKNHVIEDTKTGAKALRLGVFFGANASGKTNIIKALDIIQDIAKGEAINELSNTKHFNTGETSFIALEFCTKNVIYKYNICFSEKEIIEENLEYKEKINQNYIQIFKRNKDKFLSSQYTEIAKELRLIALNKKTISALSAICDNDAIEQEIKEKNIYNNIKNAYNFFKKDLRIIFPKMSLPTGILFHLLKKEDGFQGFLVDLLSDLNTGVVDIEFQEIGEDFVLRDVFNDDEKRRKEFEEFLNEKPQIENEQKNSDKINIMGVIASRSQRVLAENVENKIVYRTLKTVHHTKDKNIPMKYGCNSDGTKRLIDLSMSFFDATKSSVTVIDEIENSLHPHIVRELVGRFINNQSFNNAQLLLATHADCLFDQDILRKDEIYIVEKKPHGNSIIERLTDITDERFDKNLRRAYNNGYYGGIPNIFFSSF